MPGALKAAESLQKWKPGEVLYVDHAGNVASPRRVRWMSFLAPTTVGLTLGLGAALEGMLLDSPLAGLVVLGAFAGLLLVPLRHRAALRRAAGLLAADRRDDCRALLLRLDRKRLPGDARCMVDRTLGLLAWGDGRFDEALARLGRATKRGARLWSSAHRHLAAHSAALRAECFAAAGRLDEARAARATLPPSSGEIYRMTLREVDLAIAFHSGDPSALPDDDTLFEWAKAVLATGRFGPSALLLAWAFERRGDAGMAEHMLAEAPARMFGWTIDKSFPRLHAWAQAAGRAG